MTHIASLQVPMLDSPTSITPGIDRLLESEALTHKFTLYCLVNW